MIPSRFIDSESDLDSALHALTSLLPQNPKLFYPELVKQSTVRLLSELLSHENSDIALDVVQVLVELTDEDVEQVEEDDEDDERESGMSVLVAALVSGSSIQLILKDVD